MNFLSRLICNALCLMLVAACSIDPESAAVRIDVTGCGLAFDASVSGMVVGPETVVTVAHGVAQGARFTVDGRRGWVTALDLRSDLALLDVPDLDASPIRLGAVNVGDEVTVVGGQASPSTIATIVGTPTIRIEEVLGTRRIERAGLELQASLDEGDSGAGIVTGGGRLGGILFAVNDDRDGTAWAVAASEIQLLLEGQRSRWECDPGRSRLVERQP